MNALECLLRIEEKGVKKGTGKIVHDLMKMMKKN